jgi:hypothetical protein
MLEGRLILRGKWVGNNPYTFSHYRSESIDRSRDTVVWQCRGYRCRRELRRQVTRPRGGAIGRLLTDMSARSSERKVQHADPR